MLSEPNVNRRGCRSLFRWHILLTTFVIKQNIMVERIRNLLETRQLTPTQFADLIGVARPIVSHVLSGRNKPSLEVVQRILAALPELSMPWLLNGAGPMYSAAAGIPPAIAARQQEEVARITEAVAESRAVPPSTVTAAPSSAASGVTQVETSRSAAKLVKRVVSNGPVPKRFAPEFVASHPASATATAAAATATTAQASETSPSGPAQLPPPPPPETGTLSASAAGAASSENGASVATALFTGAEKPIRRIVIFYRDGSFADYQPE